MTTICHPEAEINSGTKWNSREPLGSFPNSSLGKSTSVFSPQPPAEDSKTYDIYLAQGCRATPNLDGLLEDVPALADPIQIARLMQRSPGLGFLGLDLGCSLARIVLRRLKAAGAQGYPIPSDYRGEPKITIEQATPIARRALAEWQMTPRYRHLTFDSLHFVRQKPVCWTFGASCREWLAEERIPGVLHINIDKLDGHVWQLQEFKELYDEPPYASPPPTHPRTQLVVWRPQAEQPKTYDIYLTKQCDASPIFGDLLQLVPELAAPAFLARIRQWKAGGPGFLGLNLSRPIARAVLQRLTQARACGYRIASAYREPKITAAEAMPIAEQAMAELQQRERYHGLTFDPTRLKWREPACWVFSAPCLEWYEADRVPSALHVSVDRLDGHVWQDEEFEEMADEDLPRLPVFPLPAEQPVAQREPAVV